MVKKSDVNFNSKIYYNTVKEGRGQSFHLNFFFTFVSMKKQGKYNWTMVFFLTLFPLIGIFGTAIYIYFFGVVWQEPVLMLIFWFFSGLGITMGYHRLFAHKSYQTNNFIEWVLMILGSIAFENTILKWSSDHRKHHAKSETEDDPYSITEGFWHAHIGWILKNTPEEKDKISGVKDLEKKSAIKFQNRYYFHIGIIVGLFIPLAVGFMYGRPVGALLWAGFLRITIVHHATFFINSLCHYIGRRTYDFKSTARDSWIVSFFTFGEGYHNYHHKFQWDYRNGIKWFSYDPSKWIINILSFFNLVDNLKKAKDYMIWQSKITSIRDRLNEGISQSNQLCKNFYSNRIQELDDITKGLFLNWSNMEIKYANIINLNRLEDRAILKNIRKERKQYRERLKKIQKNLNRISSSIKRNSLNPKLIIG